MSFTWSLEKILPGEYDFHINRVEEGTSKQGNDMLIFEIVIHSEAQGSALKEYITKNVIWKLRQLMTSIGRQDIFERGIAPSMDEIYGSSGRCKVGVKDGKFGPQPFVEVFLARSDVIKKQEAKIKPVPRFLDIEDEEDIPMGAPPENWGVEAVNAGLHHEEVDEEPHHQGELNC